MRYMNENFESVCIKPIFLCEIGRPSPQRKMFEDLDCSFCIKMVVTIIVKH